MHWTLQVRRATQQSFRLFLTGRNHSLWQSFVTRSARRCDLRVAQIQDLPRVSSSAEAPGHSKLDSSDEYPLARNPTRATIGHGVPQLVPGGDVPAGAVSTVALAQTIWFWEWVLPGDVPASAPPMSSFVCLTELPKAAARCYYC